MCFCQLGTGSVKSQSPILTTSWSNRDTFEICDNDREERMFRRQPGSLTDATMTRVERKEMMMKMLKMVKMVIKMVKMVTAT